MDVFDILMSMEYSDKEEKSSKNAGFVERISGIMKWISDNIPFYVKIKNLNEDDPDAPDKTAAEVGIKIKF